MKKKSQSSIILWFLLWFSIPLCAQQKNFTATDLVRLEIPTSPVISPDGGQIAFTIRKPDLEESRWRTQVYVVTIANNVIRQMTSSLSSCTSPAWSPDGNMLTFISKREGVNEESEKNAGHCQIFALPMSGGEAIAMTNLASDIEEYIWSPDGSKIAILAEEELSAERQEEAGKKAKKKMDWTSSLDPKPGKDLWILDVYLKNLKKIRTLDPGVANLHWSPDSKILVYQTNYSGEYNDEQKFDIWTIGLDGVQTQLTAMSGPETQPRFSPEGRWICFITQTVPDIEFAKTELTLMDQRGKNIRILTKNLPWSVRQFEWAPDGKEIIAQAVEKTYNSLYALEISSGKIRKLVEGQNVFGDISIAKDGTIATTDESSTTLKEIVLLKKGKLRSLTHYTDQLKAFQLRNQEVISVKSCDGKFDIEAIVVKPFGYHEGEKYPLMLAYHGGPYDNYQNVFVQKYPVQLLAQEGAIVVMPNVRGSSGYTDEFGQSVRYDIGGGDYRDAMDVVDELIKRGMIDTTKMGVMGGSYGGYLTNWTITHTGRFRAAISMYTVFSLFTDWGNSWQPAFEQMYLGYDYWDKPIDMNSLWISRSPQAYVKNIITPTLILQGTEDKYTNISNSREMYQVLKEMGKTVEFVVYPRAEHGLQTEPNQYINAMERVVAWFKKYAIGK